MKQSQTNRTNNFHQFSESKLCSPSLYHTIQESAPFIR